MELFQVRYFLAVCETLNFTRAAERCNVTQPALSRAIQHLEAEFGGPLFRRERGHTHLTDLGRLMQPRLARVLEGAQAVKSTAEGFLKLKDAPLNLGIMCTIGPLRAAAFLSAFRERHPGVELSLHEADPKRLAERLEAGELDVAVMAQPEAFPARFDVRPLYPERFMIAVAPGHRFAGWEVVPFDALSGENYLSRLNCEYYAYLDGLCQARQVTLREAYRSEREDWIQAMVLAGMGICFIPEFSPVIPGLVTRPVVDPEVSREVALVAVAGRRFSPAVAQFVKAARAYRWPEQGPGD